MPKILFLTQENPFPPNGGGKIRDAHLVRLLSEQAEVEILCIAGNQASDPSTLPAGVQLSQIQRKKNPLYKRVLYPFRPYILNGYSAEVADALKSRFETGKALWVSRLAMAKYLPLARQLGYRTVLDEHNVECDLQLSAVWASPSSWWKLPGAYYFRRLEGYFCALADAVTATSTKDALVLKRLSGKAEIEVIPNMIDIEDFSTRPAASRDFVQILFPGTLNYHPNEEGLTWFIENVLLKLKQSLNKKIRIVVAGANPPPTLRDRIERASIALHVNPTSMAPLFEDSDIVFVPLLSGSGTRLKILEAMAAGKCVVSTSKGAEGLELEEGSEILLADDPVDFAEAIIHLAENPEIRKSMATRAQLKIRSRYDWRSLRPMIKKLLDTQ
jgi:glycosyltransferase involved in cell wall biosynthesis